MKSTGMIRKIDELGRIVIPKEIRKALMLKSEQYLEMFLESDEIILKKYFPTQGISKELSIYISVFGEAIKTLLFITDNEKLILSNDKDQTLNNVPITKEIVNVIESRKPYESDQFEEKKLFGEKKIAGYFYMLPIIVNGDCNGVLVIVAQEHDCLVEERKLLILLNKLIVRTFEN